MSSKINRVLLNKKILPNLYSLSVKDPVIEYKFVTILFSSKVFL